MEKNQVKSVVSNQEGPFENLEKLVERYVNTEFLRPLAEHTKQAFDMADAFVKSRKSPVIIDSGCGTGRSSLVLAEKFPDCSVIGIDKSISRLARSGQAPKNLLWVRGELLDFWRLIKTSNWEIKHHALYYPNPWPKSSEAGRRFHLHPIFPVFLQLSESIEMRTNWEIYAEEFLKASELAFKLLNLSRKVSKESFLPKNPETAFEEKYFKSGQTLYKVCIENNTFK